MDSGIVNKIKQLFHFHKQATTLDEEYSDEIYDYLIQSGNMPLTAQQKMTIFAEVKVDYMRDRQYEMADPDKQISERAARLIHLHKFDKLPEEEVKKIGRMCKVKSIKKYFDSLNSIVLK